MKKADPVSVNQEADGLHPLCSRCGKTERLDCSEGQVPSDEYLVRCPNRPPAQEADGRRCDICADDPEPCVHCWQRRAEDAVSVVEELRAELLGSPSDTRHKQYVAVKRLQAEVEELRLSQLTAEEAQRILEAWNPVYPEPVVLKLRALASSPPSAALRKDPSMTKVSDVYGPSHRD